MGNIGFTLNYRNLFNLILIEICRHFSQSKNKISGSKGAQEKNKFMRAFYGHLIIPIFT